MTTSTPDDLIGRTIHGRYRVQARIARAGMSTVYRATDLHLDRTVAIKVMHPWLAEDPGFVTRFVGEARAAARLSHPNIVQVFDQGIDEQLGVVYLTMEFVSGRTVRELLQQHGALSPSQSLALLDPILDALGAAHRAGLVHRDVKPENVLISVEGRVKVTDFGLARALTADNQTALTRGLVIGTVAYLAPEQVESGDASPASDVYAAGIMLYELLTGNVPFTGHTPLSVAYQHVSGEVPAPSQDQEDLPVECDELTAHATAREIEDRYDNATDFLLAVRRVRRTLPAPAALNPAPPPVDDDTEDEDWLDHTVVLSPHLTEEIDEDTASESSHPGDDSQRTTNIFADELSTELDEITSAKGVPQNPVVRKRRRKRRWFIAIAVILALVAAGFGGAYAYDTYRLRDIPDVAGMKETAAQETLLVEGFQPGEVVTEFSETVRKGLVIRTEPTNQEMRPKDSTIDIILSQGKERYKVPNMRGMTLTEAAEALAKQNLVLSDNVSEKHNAKVPEDHIITSDPKKGTKLRRDSTVAVTISLGPAPVKLLDYRDQDSDEVVLLLEEQGLDVSTREEHSSEVSQGDVIRTEPSAANLVPVGGSVKVVVSKGPAPVEVPNVFGMDVKDAIDVLHDAGFLVDARPRDGLFVGLNRVSSQDPGGGDFRPPGSLIRIYFS